LQNGNYNAMPSTMRASTNDTEIAISPGQARAGRALIGWSQDRLVELSGVPKRTIARFELGDGSPQRRTLTAIRNALEAAGVEFIAENGGGPGVRLRKAKSDDRCPKTRI
jgi:transcriptional regulator with XRE-family HTH domain